MPTYHDRTESYQILTKFTTDVYLFFFCRFWLSSCRTERPKDQQVCYDLVQKSNESNTDNMSITYRPHADHVTDWLTDQKMNVLGRAKEARTVPASSSIMPPILGFPISLRRRTRKELLADGVQVFHFVVGMCFLWAGLVEFIRNPPYFDAYGDAVTRNELPQDLFENDPRNLDKTQSLRVMDLPILFILCAYFVVCWWLRFKGRAWLLTACMLVALVCFFLVNFWAGDFFNWRYYDSRMNGLMIQVASLSLSLTTVFVVLFYERKKMPFKFKSTLPIKPFGKVHVIWNFVTIYIIIFACLMLWFTKLYASWACFKTVREVLHLCETTNMVQCYACNECDSDGLKACVKEKHKLFHCASPMEDVSTDKGAFCLFNYNISLYTSLTVFAYIGGLVVFMSTFFRVTVHYMFRGIFLVWHWSKVRLSARDGHRPSTDQSDLQDFHEEISEPFQCVEVRNGATGLNVDQHSVDCNSKEYAVEQQEEEANGLVQAIVA